MATQLDNIRRLLNQIQFSEDAESVASQILEDYGLKPENVQTQGFLQEKKYPAITPPLTEKSRTEETFTVTAGGTVYVPTQIIFTDAAGHEVVFNFSMPTMS